MKWSALVALATAQFVMVLDQSVMNVSISTLVKDFDTTVTTIQVNLRPSEGERHRRQDRWDAPIVSEATDQRRQHHAK